MEYLIDSFDCATMLLSADSLGPFLSTLDPRVAELMT